MPRGRTFPTTGVGCDSIQASDGQGPRSHRAAMSTLIRRRYGRLGLQLALAFVFVAVGAVVAATYPQAGTRAAWARALTPVIAVADRSGSVMRVRDMTGQIVRSSPGYGSIPPGLPIRRAPVRAGGRRDRKSV